MSCHWLCGKPRHLQHIVLEIRQPTTRRVISYIIHMPECHFTRSASHIAGSVVKLIDSIISYTISYHISYHLVPYMLSYRWLCGKPYHIISYMIPYHTIPYHTIPYHTIPYHTIPYRTISYHIISYHILSYPISYQVMAWCRQATSHYLSQCWPSFLSPYGVTRP